MIVPPLDPNFVPFVLERSNYLAAIRENRGNVPLRIALERQDRAVTIYETEVCKDYSGAIASARTARYVERLVKQLLWACGGWKVSIGGPAGIGQYVQSCYAEGGKRVWDAQFMGDVYERTFTVESMVADEIPQSNEGSMMIGRHLDGCRIGFDAGASDRKVAAVIEGESVWEDETDWTPKGAADPNYHFTEIMSALSAASQRMPRVDAIGVSAAGIYIGNRTRVGSLYRGVSKARFSEVEDLFPRIQKAWRSVPLEVANDGDVTALAGSMSLEANKVLGIALGSSEAGGYVDADGGLKGWLNEVAFVPIGIYPDAPEDEWSRDCGCGVSYFSQVAVIRLAGKLGVEFEPEMTDADKLAHVQHLVDEDVDPELLRIFETIGVWLGYGIADYANLYDIEQVLILGRVTSGRGGPIILEQAQAVLQHDFPELASRLKLALPNERLRRVGQAVAAASLPAIN